MNGSEWIDKPAAAWRLQDLEGLAGAEEGVYLEFKRPNEFMDQGGKFSPDRLSTELAETVSAFLNSAGGVLLIGVQTNKSDRDKKSEVLRPPKEWVVDQTFEHLKVSLTASQVRDRIYGNILPRPFGVDVKNLDLHLNNTKTTVFVVRVPASSIGAHQAVPTRCYYRRISDGDVPMLDHEIRDVNNRRAGPLLHLACALIESGTSLAEDEWKTSKTGLSQIDFRGEPFQQVNVVFAVTNLGRGTANIARFDVGIPEPWQVSNYAAQTTSVGSYWIPNNALQSLLGNQVRVVWKPEQCPAIPNALRSQKLSEQDIAWQTVIYNGNDPPAHPVWPVVDRVVIGVLELHLRNTPASGTSYWWLPWRIFTEGMPETRGAALLSRVGSQLIAVNCGLDAASWVAATERFETLTSKFAVP